MGRLRHPRSFPLPALPQFLLAGVLSLPLQAQAAAVVSEQFRTLAFSVFGCIITIPLIIAYIAARRSSSAGEFYTAGGGVTGLMNGLAIAGDICRRPLFWASPGWWPCMDSMAWFI